jgi:hypothetical protein
MEFTFTFEDAKKKVRVNPNKGATQMNRKKEIGQPIIFDTLFDFSGSMSEFYGELIDCFNDIMIPSLKEASQRCKQSMRLGCLLFSDKMVPAWEGFKTLEELGPNPLKKNVLNKPGLQGWTALYGAMRAGVLWTAAAMEHMRENGRGEVPKGKVIVLSDGANNRDPKNESAVTDALSSIGKLNLRNLQSTIGFFNTEDGLSRSQFDAMVAKTGFTGLGFYEIAKGGSLEDKRKSFRHHFKIFSSQAAR